LARKELRALVGPRKKFKELMKGSDLAGILAYYEAHHNRVLEETAGWGDADLAALSPFWEKAPKTVHYRLHRFGAHLRQHTVQAEKTLIAIGRPASEVKKLLRLVFNALAEAEGAIIGAGDFGREQIQGLGERIVVRAEKVHG
jgi:hypothetical protein